MKRNVDLTENNLFSNNDSRDRLNTISTELSGVRIRTINNESELNNYYDDVDFLFSKKKDIMCPTCGRIIKKLPYSDKIGDKCGRCMIKYGGEMIYVNGWIDYKSIDTGLPWEFNERIENHPVIVW